MSFIIPTPGRIVWYYPNANSEEGGFARAHGGAPLAAIVAQVLASTVNLTVFDAKGVPHSRTAVRLVQEGHIRPIVEEFCEWMPYQKGQAAKTEAFEAAIKGA